MPETWEDRFESLRASRVLTHNADYLEFLVSKVWRIDRQPLKIVEFGCGYGRFASMLLPLLASGSSSLALIPPPRSFRRAKRFSPAQSTQPRSYEATFTTLHCATLGST